MTVPFVFQELCHVYLSLDQCWRSPWEDFSAESISHWKVIAASFLSFLSFLVRSFVGSFLLFSSSLNLEGFDMAGEDAHAFTAE